MDDYLLVAVSCLFFLPSGFNAKECSEAVLARREASYAPAGGSLSLSCVVQHCGHTWTGEWMWRNLTDVTLRAVIVGARHQLTKVSLSANQTKLLLTFQSVTESDEGSYACKVTWGQGKTDQGHFTHVNITAAVPSQRNVLHRVMVCVGAFLCLPIILALARCLSSEVKPQPLPRTRSTYPAQPAAAYRAQPHLTPQPPPRRPVPQKRSTSSHKACPKPQQKTEVVYADISKHALSQQPATRQPAQSTVYSLPMFST